MMSERGFRDVFYSAQDGLKLHARLYGEANPGLPVVCLPGLTRNARDFHALAEKLSTDATTPRKVIAFDYRGRGLSDNDPDWRRYDVTVEAADIVSGLAAFGVEHAAFIGTSRGGLIIMALAGARPTLMKAVVLNDIGPVVEGDGLARSAPICSARPNPVRWPRRSKSRRPFTEKRSRPSTMKTGGVLPRRFTEKRKGACAPISIPNY
ncbi:alpha/beta hydrolase [Nitratireductor aquibiodomus]|uniref:alpha/beta fold hydrolase n=1 Tax=Nitratireductor aquibiodomus TaxID=204799 RepID=UPI0002E69CF0